MSRILDSLTALLRRRRPSGPERRAPGGPLSNEEYLRRLYRELLRREPDATGFRKLLADLESGVDPKRVFADFIYSAEYESRAARPVSERSLYRPLGHFYSPVVDPEQLRRRYRQIFESEAEILDVDLRLEAQERLFAELTEAARELPFGDSPLPPLRYHYDNPSFGHADGTILAAMVLRYRPARIVEVGCGMSSCLLLDLQERFLGDSTEIDFVDPYPESFLERLDSDDRARLRLHRQPTQEVDLELFRGLGAGDFLVIDSTHVSKTDSDVNHHLFRILPALEEGVVIHFHDVFFPFEYPPEWLLEENRSWNETYLLRAFLAYNRSFRILFWNDLFLTRHRELVEATLPHLLRNTGGSIWLEKRAAGGQ